MDGVSVGGSCDPLADGAKSCSSASVKGQPWRIQPKAEGAGAFVPPFLFFKNLGKLEFRMSLGYGNRTAHGFTAVMGLSFLPRLLSLQVWLLLRIPAASEIYFLEEV